MRLLNLLICTDKELSMKKKNKRLKRSLLLIIVIVTSSILILASYVLQYNKQLMTYQKSLTNLPEVNQVLEISEYSGTESYYVAKVVLTTNQEYYYFIKDNIVEYSYRVDELITSNQAAEKALKTIGKGTVTHYYLGIYEQNPVYEVSISSTNGEEYVIVDAKNGEVVLQFIVN